MCGSSPRLRGTLQNHTADSIKSRFIPAFAGNAPHRFLLHRRRAVHPRVCGERLLSSRKQYGPNGSSPRLRGTHNQSQAGRWDRRFIPAFAGNAQARQPSSLSSAVHPRVCGERIAADQEQQDGAGSSPRLRGTRVEDVARYCTHRFIPAFAGNACHWSASTHPLSVHPRVCGERPCDPGARDPNGGSSPRLRGTRGRVHRTGRCERFIPAFAGNAGRTSRTMRANSVHPRVCGERRSWRNSPRPLSGSSPRLRGTHHHRQRGRCRHRFIPAFAGNAGLYTGRVPAASVHPRVCGERGHTWNRSLCCPGSSPRLRGTPVPPLPRRLRGRFIPAFAGNAEAGKTLRSILAVHPRVCGERTAEIPAKLQFLGSSPRLRGTPFLDSWKFCFQRFIPAFAGNAAVRAARARSPTVHPRVCGERHSRQRSGSTRIGSSPRLRGTPDVRAPATHIPRFIPAFAGNAP